MPVLVGQEVRYPSWGSKLKVHTASSRPSTPKATFGRGFQIQARPNGLNAQVILLVDHDAHAAVLPDQRGAGFGPAPQGRG